MLEMKSMTNVGFLHYQTLDIQTEFPDAGLTESAFVQTGAPPCLHHFPSPSPRPGLEAVKGRSWTSDQRALL